MSCMLIGDSIAVGTAFVMPQCQSIAQKGISSSRFVAELLKPVVSDTVIISLGSNDRQVDLVSLKTVRSAVTAKKVIWLIPYGHSDRRNAIIKLASEHGDGTIDIVPFTGADKVHPTQEGYKSIARDIQK